MAPGHSLLELLVTLTILAVTAALAVPSFSEWRMDIRRDAAIHALAHAVHSGRQLAAATGQPVSLCGTADGRRCADSRDWSSGLLLVSAGGAVRRNLGFRHQPEALRLQANRNAIVFEPTARHATTATITLCDRRGAAAARAIIVSRSGRPRSDQRDGSGRPLAC